MLPTEPIPPHPYDAVDNVVENHLQRLLWGLRAGAAMLRTWPSLDVLWREHYDLYIGAKTFSKELGGWAGPGSEAHSDTFDFRHVLCALLPEPVRPQVTQAVPPGQVGPGSDFPGRHDFVMDFTEYTPLAGDEPVPPEAVEAAPSIEDYQDMRARNTYHAVASIVEDIEDNIRRDTDHMLCHDLLANVVRLLPYPEGPISGCALRNVVLTGRALRLSPQLLIGQRGFHEDLTHLASWLVGGHTADPELRNLLRSADEWSPARSLAASFVLEFDSEARRVREGNPYLVGFWEDGGGALAWARCDVSAKLVLLGVPPAMAFLLHTHVFLHTGLMQRFQMGPYRGAWESESNSRTNSGWSSQHPDTLRLKSAMTCRLASLDVVDVASWLDADGNPLCGQTLLDRRALLRRFCVLRDQLPVPGRGLGGLLPAFRDHKPFFALNANGDLCLAVSMDLSPGNTSMLRNHFPEGTVEAAGLFYVPVTGLAADAEHIGGEVSVAALDARDLLLHAAVTGLSLSIMTMDILQSIQVPPLPEDDLEEEDDDEEEEEEE